MARALPRDRLKANITPVATFAHHRASLSLSSLSLSSLSRSNGPFTFHDPSPSIATKFRSVFLSNFDSLVTGVELTILDYYSYRMAQQ